jgi:hypothetical protein
MEENEGTKLLRDFQLNFLPTTVVNWKNRDSINIRGVTKERKTISSNVKSNTCFRNDYVDGATFDGLVEQ